MKLALSALLSLAVLASSAANGRAEPIASDAPGALNDELFALWEIAACGTPVRELNAITGVEKLRAEAGKVIDDHCKKLQKTLDLYTKEWLTPARPFFAQIVPQGIPKKVVYPFAGGDLMTALAIYPDFDELTTISLESGGDARGIFRVDGKALDKALEGNRRFIGELVEWNHNRTIDLGKMEMSPLPSQLIFALVGLKVHGYEPVSLNALAIEADGSLRVMGPSDFAKIDATAAKSKSSMKNKALNEAFSHYELNFKRPGDARVRTYRHFMMNLSDKSLTEDPRILKHLEKKGTVSTMTKAASHLLWHGGFSKIRDYLKARLAVMVSDSTGLNPMHLEPEKFEQTVYGRFDTAVFNPTAGGQVALRALFASQPLREVPMKRFGYPTKGLKTLCIVTTPRK
jgi:hypothetical protein